MMRCIVGSIAFGDPDSCLIPLYLYMEDSSRLEIQFFPLQTILALYDLLPLIIVILLVHASWLNGLFCFHDNSHSGSFSENSWLIACFTINLHPMPPCVMKIYL